MKFLPLLLLLTSCASLLAPARRSTPLPLFVDDDGDGKVPVQPLQPAQGQPARDPWSGALTGELTP